MNMNTIVFAAALSFASLVRADAPDDSPSKGKLIINGFRMPSIGLEYRKSALSWHAGMYPTILSKDDAGEYETTWFGRAGMTWWPLSFLFVDASYLYGLNKDYRKDHAVILNPGLQYIFLDTVVLRLGVAALASANHSVKINPTPGIGLSFAL
jgi:hypothetical protein